MFENLIAAFQSNPWAYIAIPFISAGVGWATNVIAIKMMFYPIEFFGIKPVFGWQGIVPSKAEKMASIACDLMLKRLVNVREIFQRLDPNRIASDLEGPLLKMTNDVVDNVMDSYQPGLWEGMPQIAKNRVYASARKETPAIIAKLMAEMRDNIENVFDVKNMVINNLMRDKALLNRIFLETGKQEFVFIGRSGAYFGFLFGLIQAVVFLFWPNNWVLPIAGLLVGYFTNWIALKMIFLPQEPRKVGPFVVQGLFHKRQQEVAADYGALIADEILTPANMMEEIINGRLSDNLINLVTRHVKNAVDEQAGITKPFVVLAVGGDAYKGMKAAAVETFVSNIPDAMHHIEDYAQDAMDVKNTIIDRMKKLTSEEFESLIRPAFEEDEWMLICTGAALGFAAGVAQLVLIFGGAIMA